MFELGLNQLAEIFTRLEKQAIHVCPSQCSKVRHRRSTCTLCADYCPVNAITWGESLQVDPEKCTSCGICAAVCPTGALEAQAPTNLELLARIRELAKKRTSVAFACPIYLKDTPVEDDRCIRVHCLGRLDESILVGALSAGIQSVQLVVGACTECPHAIGRTLAEQTAQRANLLLHAFGLPEGIFVSPQLPVEPGPTPRSSPMADESISRRSFFNRLKQETVRTAAVSVENILSNRSEEPKKGELPARLPAKRRLLLEALRRIGKPVVSESQAASSLWAQFDFKETCNGCQMCAFFCPTGALRKVEKGGKVGVAFRISHCTACRLCQEICDWDAVTLSSAVDLSKVLVGDSVDVLLMKKREECPWLVSPEERMKRLLESSDSDAD